MKIEVLPDADCVAREAAKHIAEEASGAVKVRVKFIKAVSGGKTPWIMLRNLERERSRPKSTGTRRQIE